MSKLQASQNSRKFMMGTVQFEIEFEYTELINISSIRLKLNLQYAIASQIRK